MLVVAPTRQPRLSTQQQQELIAEAAKGEFSTIAEILRWVEQSFGISYTEVGMWKKENPQTQPCEKGSGSRRAF